METLCFTLNGVETRVEVLADETLLTVLRDRLHLTGTKGACLEGECGSCTGLLAGRPVNSCLTLALSVADRSVLTIEGLSDGRSLSALQRAFLQTGAAQCGYCTPGLILAAYALLQQTPRPSEDELLRAMEGNLCRCTGYKSIIEAIRIAAREVGS